MDGPARLVWQIKDTRCTITPHKADPPFVVRVYRNDIVIFMAGFSTHDAATEVAVEQLHAARGLADQP